MHIVTSVDFEGYYARHRVDLSLFFLSLAQLALMDDGWTDTRRTSVGRSVGRTDGWAPDPGKGRKESRLERRSALRVQSSD